jgi:hypothetical protein
VLVCHVGDYPADAIHRLNAFTGVFVGQSPKVTFELLTGKVVHVYKRMHFSPPFALISIPVRISSICFSMPPVLSRFSLRCGT